MRRLNGRQILVAEDDALVAHALCRSLSELGATILGPAPSVTAALQIASGATLHAALLDVDLGGELVYPVADVLIARGVPFVMTTATSLCAMPVPYWHLPREEKPFCPPTLAARIAAICATSEAAPLPSFTPSLAPSQGLRAYA